VNSKQQHSDYRLQQRNIAKYLPLVERVAKVEYRRVPNHMVDYEELVSIGAIAVQNILKGKSAEQIDKLNISYIATATRWAIRNELRTRYKWYTLKHTKSPTEETEETTEAPEGGEKAEGAEGSETKAKSPEAIREAVYETILSIDGITEGQDGDSSYDCISDDGVRPDEHLEIVELGKAIKRAIESLPPKERTIVEYRFYRNMQVKEIASLVGLSSSRVTRIVQASLDMVREYLKEMEQID
jgi:RNA polymerase sigma factor (sigma-70 family)